MGQTQQAPAKPPFSLRAEIEEWLRTIVFGLLWYFCIITFVVEAYKIPSNSMHPTLFGSEGWGEGDRVLAIKAIDRFRPLQRGDIVVFNSVEAADQQRRLVKRLVALPGETVEIVEVDATRREGKLAVDGKIVTEPPVFRELVYEPTGFLALGRKYKIPAGCYLMLGDNTHHSRDGRMWGVLPAENILGRALFIWWKLGRIKSLNPHRQHVK